jgi:hypothetical protein
MTPKKRLETVRAGEAVVQFAKRANSSREFAIKFYLDPESFRTEAQLYATFVPSLRGLVPEGPTETGDSPRTAATIESGITAQNSFSKKEKPGVASIWLRGTRGTLPPLS